MIFKNWLSYAFNLPCCWTRPNSKEFLELVSVWSMPSAGLKVFFLFKTVLPFCLAHHADGCPESCCCIMGHSRGSTEAFSSINHDDYDYRWPGSNKGPPKEIHKL